VKPDLLVFSKDRPAQLDLLLRSIREHANRLYASRTVLWRASAPEYEHGYQVCVAENPGWTWWREYAFEQNVRWWLSQTGETCSFLVDDDVFYRDAPAGVDPPCSLRGGDYDYPFSLDGNVYRSADVAALLEGVRFTDPTEMEARGHELRERLPFDHVVPVQPPCLVGVPANRVSTSSRMPHMGVHEYELNERYLAGGRLRPVEAERPLPAHAELGYLWA
jgi:hypothetical protein